MAQLKDLLVTGPVKIIGNVNFNKIPKYNNTELALNKTIKIAASDGLNNGDLGDEISLNGNNTQTIVIKHNTLNQSLEDLNQSTRTYIDSIAFDDYGHVISYGTSQETVVDTNTAHGHANGKGTTASGGGINGSATIDLNIALELKTIESQRYISIYDKSDANKVSLAQLDVDEFIVDGILDKVELVNKDADNNSGTFLKFTWNTISATNKQKITYVNVAYLLNIYDADESTLTLSSVNGNNIFSIKDSGVNTDQIADDAVTTAKIYDQAVTNQKIFDKTIEFNKLATTAYSEDGNRSTSYLVVPAEDGQINSEKFAITSGKTVKAIYQYNSTSDCVELKFI